MTSPSPSDASDKLGDLAASIGLERIHVLAWRDLDDVEAGGSEVHADEIIRRWAAAGIDITVRTSYAYGQARVVQRNGYRVIRRAGRYGVFPRAVASELLGWHGQRDGLIEIWNGVPWFSPVWHRGPRAVILHHLHRRMWDLVLPRNPRLAKAGQLLERRLAPPFYRSTPIITLSESSRGELIREMGLQPDLVNVVPPGIDGRFSRGGQKADTPLVVAVSRLMPPKQFDMVIRAAHRARERCPDLELVIVGTGPEAGSLRQQIQDLDATSWATLAGRVSDAELIDLYRRAWVLASASVAEGWGMVVTEAAACGTPAVVTDIAGHRDAVIDGESGLLVRGELELADQLANVLVDTDLRRALTSGAIDRAAQLTWDQTAHRALSTMVDDARRRLPDRSGSRSPTGS